MAEKNLPFWRQLDFFGAADEERLIQLFFQHLDGLADGGLRDIELFDASEKLKETAT